MNIITVKWKPLCIHTLFASLIFCITQFQSYCGTPHQLIPRLKGYLGSPYGYWEYLPANYDGANRLPVVIYLHGIKEIGAGTSMDELKKILRNGPPLLIDRDNRSFPFILISPQSPGVHEGFAAHRIDSLIDIVTAHYKADVDRIYITGLSFGGYATWKAAEYSGKKIAAAVPICSCVPTLDARKLRQTPVFAFVNSGDNQIPGCMFSLIESIQSVGGTALLHTYNRKGHNAWHQTYAENMMWDWLLKQRRSLRYINQPPTFANPGTQIFTVGFPRKLTIHASDSDGDTLSFLLDEPLPEGVSFREIRSGVGTFTFSLNGKLTDEIHINVVDKKGAKSRLSLPVFAEYPALLIPVLCLFFFQTLSTFCRPVFGYVWENKLLKSNVKLYGFLMHFFLLKKVSAISKKMMLSAFNSGTYRKDRDDHRD